MNADRVNIELDRETAEAAFHFLAGVVAVPRDYRKHCEEAFIPILKAAFAFKDALGLPGDSLPNLDPGVN